MKTLSELCDTIRNVLPSAQIEEDNDGQLVIYTGLKNRAWDDGTHEGDELVPVE